MATGKPKEKKPPAEKPVVLPPGSTTLNNQDPIVEANVVDSQTKGSSTVTVIDINMPVVMSVTDKAIAQLQKYKELKISGEGDKDGYNAVYKARQLVKRTRIELDAEADKLKEVALAWQRKVNGEKVRITTELKDIEAHLQAEEDKYNDAVEEIRRKKQEERDRVLQLRIDELQAVGSRVTLAFLRGLSDEEYDKMLADATAAFNAEQIRKQQEEDERRKREDQLARDREEADRVRAELDKQRKELAEQQQRMKEQADEEARKQKAEVERMARELQEEKDRAEKARIDARNAMGDLRYNRLLKLGMNFVKQDGSVVYGGVCVSEHHIFNASDEEFEKVFDECAASVKQIKDQEAKEAEDRRIALEKKMAEDADKKAKADAEAKKKAEEEQIRKSDDVQKAKAMLYNIKDVEIYTMNSAEGQEMNIKLAKHLNNIVNLLTSFAGL